MIDIKCKKRNSKKVYSSDTLESAAISILEKEKVPLSANAVNKGILNEYKVTKMRTTPNKIASVLGSNPNVRVIKRRGAALYELF